MHIAGLSDNYTGVVQNVGSEGIGMLAVKEKAMDGTSGRDVIRRCPRNPLIFIDDLPFSSSDIWNAGIVRYEQGYLMLITVEMLEGRCALYRADSDDGEHFTVDAQAFMAPADSGPQQMYENMGVRDPRITSMDGWFYITYVADGDHGLRLGLARTKDFRSVERVGYISQVDVKNGVLFPCKVGGRYLLLKRPDAGSSIWLSYSDDLVFWGSSTVVMTPRGRFWDSTRIGAAAPPIEIDEGWLLIYYGEKSTSAGPLVRLGAAILDREDPSKVLARSNIPILSPREKYERIGDVPNVVFSCGALLEDGRLNLYYGASDSCICRGSAPLEDILQVCFDSERKF